MDFDGFVNSSAQTNLIYLLFGPTHLHGNVPGHVDVAFELIHPNLRHPEGVASDVRGEVLGVRFMGALDVGDASAGQDLDAAAALPHLMRANRQSSDVTHPHP